MRATRMEAATRSSTPRPLRTMRPAAVIMQKSLEVSEEIDLAR